MFAIVRGQNIRLISRGTPFTLEVNGEDYQFPANWLQFATPEDKTFHGILEVVYEPRPNDSLYFVTMNPPVLDGDVVRVHYTAIPRDLEELKAVRKAQIKAAAYSLLAPSDYMAVYFLSDPEYKPAWKSWREAVITVSREACAAIDRMFTVSDMDEAPRIEWPSAPT